MRVHARSRSAFCTVKGRSRERTLLRTAKATRASKSSAGIATETVLSPKSVPPLPVKKKEYSESATRQRENEPPSRVKGEMGEGRTWSDKDLVDARALGQLPRESVFPSSCTDQENPELLQGGGGASHGVKAGRSRMRRDGSEDGAPLAQTRVWRSSWSTSGSSSDWRAYGQQQLLRLGVESSSRKVLISARSSFSGVDSLAACILVAHSHTHMLCTRICCYTRTCLTVSSFRGVVHPGSLSCRLRQPRSFNLVSAMLVLSALPTCQRMH